MRKILADENRHDQRAKTASHELTHRRQSTAMSDFLSCWGQTNVGVPPKGRPEDDYCSPGEMTSEGRETIRGRPFRLSPIDRITLPFPGGDKESALAASDCARAPALPQVTAIASRDRPRLGARCASSSRHGGYPVRDRGRVQANVRIATPVAEGARDAGVGARRREFERSKALSKQPTLRKRPWQKARSRRMADDDPAVAPQAGTV